MLHYRLCGKEKFEIMVNKVFALVGKKRYPIIFLYFWEIKMNLRLLISFALMFLITGCATMFSDAFYYGVKITGPKPGIDFVITDREGKTVHSGVTPEKVTLPASTNPFRGKRYTIIYELPGESKDGKLIKSSIDVVNWNFLAGALGGLFGFLLAAP